MIRNLAMLVLCLAVAGAMAAILKFFFRKLVKIEKDLWGERARQATRAGKKPHAA